MAIERRFVLTSALRAKNIGSEQQLYDPLLVHMPNCSVTYSQGDQPLIVKLLRI